jgi:hypothetical protein
MKAATQDCVADLAISLVAIGGAGLAFGPEGAVVASVAAGIAAPLNWALKVVFSPSPSGSAAVMAQLIRRK